MSFVIVLLRTASGERTRFYQKIAIFMSASIQVIWRTQVNFPTLKKKTNIQKIDKKKRFPIYM